MICMCNSLSLYYPAWNDVHWGKHRQGEDLIPRTPKLFEIGLLEKPSLSEALNFCNHSQNSEFGRANFLTADSGVLNYCRRHVFYLTKPYS
jgi:hypothetical protein